MRYVALLTLITLPLFAADDAVKPPAPPADVDVAQAPTEAPKHVSKQPQRKTTDEDRAAIAAVAAKKREIKKLEKDLAQIEKDIAANEAEVTRIQKAGQTGAEGSAAKREARANIARLKKELSAKAKELDAARAE
jgi:predicted RNase H-like nuclease (RuvC/YqgF family)